MRSKTGIYAAAAESHSSLNDGLFITMCIDSNRSAAGVLTALIKTVLLIYAQLGLALTSRPRRFGHFGRLPSQPVNCQAILLDPNLSKTHGGRLRCHRSIPLNLCARLSREASLVLAVGEPPCSVIL